MNTPVWVQIVGFLLALSGWGKVVFDWINATPRVRGRIFNVMRGIVQNPGKPGEQLTSFTTYLYLVNTSKNSVHILDYEMQIKLAGKWRPLQRMYGIHNINNLTFFAPDGAKIQIESFSENLIYRKNLPAEFGKPLHGWIVFAGSAELHSADITCYRIKCIDVYGKNHTFQSTPEEFANLYLLQDMAGISLPDSARKP